MTDITNHITIVGMPGTGKSLISKAIAKLTGLQAIDSDGEIEKASGLTINRLFECYGEKHFRDGECRVMKRILETKSPCVIATGGGTYINPEAKSIIDRYSTSVWLDVDLDTIWQRVKNKSHRPLLNVTNPYQKLFEIYSERKPIYASANIRVTNNNDNPSTAGLQIIVAVKQFITTTRQSNSIK